MLTLTNNEIGGLIRGEELTRFPPVRRPTSELESFYASLLKEITHLAGCAEKTEWEQRGMAIPNACPGSRGPNDGCVDGLKG